MINFKSNLIQALEANTTLTGLLGVDSEGYVPIYQSVAKDDLQYPRITFFELNNRDSTYYDNTAYASDISFQIDIWSKGSTSDLAEQLDIIMKSMNFKRDHATDLYENDTKIFHKAMRYSANITI